jgi:WD40 repeat protein
VQLHASLDASDVVPSFSGGDAAAAAVGGGAFSNGHHNTQQQNKAAVSSIAIWDTSGQIKIFTGSHDGCWRLWNTATWQKEFESKVGTQVEQVCVTNNFLFCGMEASSPRALPIATVGMCHIWNLGQPNMPPMELHLDGTFLPYAHNLAVTALCIQDSTLVTGSRDGCIRIWKFSNNAFVLDKTLFGQAREVTGLVIVDPAAGAGIGGASPAGAPTPGGTSMLLWSSSLDGSMRIWDMTTGACQYSITSSPPQQPGQPVVSPINTAGQGHTNAVTALESFHSPAGTFVLSASLDGTIKAWNGLTGECVASEQHGEGVISLAIAHDPTNTEILLVGLESGNIVGRNLVQTPKAAAFEALFCLTAKFNQGHSEAVRCITPGPQATFYTGGGDGKLMVWQINGDLQLK